MPQIETEAVYAMKYFSEYLNNLDRVNLSFELDPCNDFSLKSSEANQLVFLQEGGKTSRIIHLPTNTQTLSLTKYPGSQKSLSIRLNATKSKTSKSEEPLIKNAFDPPRLGSGAFLAPKVQWKQLPSEHWAELMDLWHCHKPSEPSKGDAGLYSLALNGFHPRPGLAYFSETYYLIHADDISPEIQGSVELTRNNESEIKIWKWDLATDGTVSPVFSRILAELTDAHATFTFKVNSKLNIWVLKTDAIFSVSDCSGPLRGMKVYYSELEMCDKRPDAEELNIPESALRKLLKELDFMNARLPASVQVMNNWKLSFLPESEL